MFDLIYTDIWGPYNGENMCNTRFILTVVEDHSRVLWTFMLETTEKVYEVMEKFIKMVQIQFGKIIKGFRSDNGSEFKSNGSSNY